MAYGEAAALYRERGWAGVLPVVGKHEHLPEGFTGYAGRWPDGDDVDGWVATRGADNVAIRVPSDVIGLDVDAYDGRRGLETLAFWEGDEQCGPLPPTWMSTARTDGSGVRLYRVPGGAAWRSDLGAGSNVEVIRFAHRYFVAWPSVHPLISRRYEWYDPTGALRDDGPPIPQELPLLPDRWVAALEKRHQLRADGGSHRDDDVDALDHEGERVDPRLLLLEGAPAGEQQAELFRYLCSLRARGAHEQEMITLGIAVMQQFDNARADEPWTVEHVVELVHRVRDTYGPGLAAEPLTDVQREFIRRLGTDDAPRADEILEAAGPANASETGNALTFARLYGDEVRYAADVDRWYRWQTGRWRPAQDAEMLYLTEAIPPLIRLEHPGQDDREWRRWALQSESAAHRAATLRLASARPELLCLTTDFDRDPDLLVVRNGTLDLVTGELREGRREDLCTQLAEVDFAAGDYDPLTDCPMWARHVMFVAGSNQLMYDYLRRALGYSLTGRVGDRAFFFLEGRGHNGKNALVEPIIKLLGSYAMTASTALLLGDDTQHPTILADLLGKRMVFVDEVPRDKKLNVSRVKGLTGGTRVKARRMREDFFEFDARFKLWLAGNGKPRVNDPGDGIWDRMHLVPCLQRVPDDMKIPEFGTLMYEREAPGILRWLLEGARDWRQLESVGRPDFVGRAVDEYREEESYERQFVADTMDVTDSPADRLTTDEIYLVYAQSWAPANGLRGFEVMKKIPLARALTDLGLRRSAQGWRTANGYRNGFEGVRWKQIARVSDESSVY